MERLIESEQLELIIQNKQILTFERSNSDVMTTIELYSLYDYFETNSLFEMWKYRKKQEERYDLDYRKVRKNFFQDIYFYQGDTQKIFFWFLKEQLSSKNISDLFLLRVLKGELSSENRYFRSYLYTMMLSSYLEEGIVVSGLIETNEKDFCPHVWVEYQKNQVWYVIDVARNLIMKKEDYFSIENVVPATRLEAYEINAILLFLQKNYIFVSNKNVCFCGLDLMPKEERIQVKSKKEFYKKRLPNYEDFL